MRINKMAVPRKEAKRALAAILASRHKTKPDIIKPDSISPFEFPDLGIPEIFRTGLGSEWENLDWRSFFEYGFSEDDRTRAEQIGIVYERRLIEVVPVKFRRKMLENLEELRESLEDVLKDPKLRALRNPATEDQARVLRACQNPESLYWIHLAPLVPQVAHLNHDKAVFSLDGNWRPDWNFFEAFVNALEEGILRDPRASDWRAQFMYLKKYESEVDTVGDSVYGSGEIQVRFHINVARLLESRNVFTDPEGFTIPDEYGKTYMVKGGIPVNAIDGWSFWEGNTRPPYVKLP